MLDMGFPVLGCQRSRFSCNKKSARCKDLLGLILKKARGILKIWFLKRIDKRKHGKSDHAENSKNGYAHPDCMNDFLLALMHAFSIILTVSESNVCCVRPCLYKGR